MSLASLPERIRSKIHVNPDTECWEWMAWRTEEGYGRVRWDGRMAIAHRVVYRLLVGDYPPGTQHDHLCRVRYCVNPGHGEPVTSSVNVLRSSSPALARARLSAALPMGRAGKNSAKTHCDHGHPFSGDNLYARPGGGRGCKACRNAAAARHRRKVSA